MARRGDCCAPHAEHVATNAATRASPRRWRVTFVPLSSPSSYEPSRGALVALHQAEHAGEPSIRGALRRIARDEVRHAAFSWMLDDWCRPRLSPAARERILQARTNAVTELESELRFEVPDADRKRLGLPARSAARGMLRELRERLWAPR
jgi:hypothetical protein